MVQIVSYDKNNDILVVHKGFSADETFKRNIDVGDLILDVSTRGRIRGIEIMHASQFLKEFEIGEEILNSLIEADFNAVNKPNGIVIGFIFKSKDIEQQIPAKVVVPMEVPSFL